MDKEQRTYINNRITEIAARRRRKIASDECRALDEVAQKYKPLYDAALAQTPAKPTWLDWPGWADITVTLAEVANVQHSTGGNVSPDFIFRTLAEAKGKGLETKQATDWAKSQEAEHDKRVRAACEKQTKIKNQWEEAKAKVREQFDDKVVKLATEVAGLRDDVFLGGNLEDMSKKLKALRGGG